MAAGAPRGLDLVNDQAFHAQVINQMNFMRKADIEHAFTQ